MDFFGGLSCEGEWDLCSSILSLADQDQLDFTPINNNIPDEATGAAGIADAWFCSNLDSFTTANLPASSVFGAYNSRDHENYDHAYLHQFPCISAADDDHHMSMSSAAIFEEKKMESLFSACTDIFLQEITGFCSEEDRFVNNMDNHVETHQGDHPNINASNPANALLHHKRKSSIAVPDDINHDDQNKLKKIRTSNNNVQKSRKGTESNGKRKQKLSTTSGRKCELEDQENGGSDMNMSCSTDNSSDQDDNASQLLDTNGKGKTRATRGSATDPQSLYARKRRERINERLKILQKLVPNGTKVDISTMLEEAVHYVKFLQLQIKLLSSDELWMYAPIAYNGMDIGLLQQNLSSFL